MKRCLILIFALALGCGSDTTGESKNWEVREDLGSPDQGADQGEADQSFLDIGTCAMPEPVAHRPSGANCDNQRVDAPPIIDTGGAPVDCTEHADCTEGKNGRCSGNSHDGWYCTYDLCFADDECDGVCECGGGFRSDFNVCLPGDCVTDADCGETGFCSPSYGDCGNYIGTAAYYCHTCEDECVNDSDCGDGEDYFAEYCMYEPGQGRWVCSDQHCAG